MYFSKTKLSAMWLRFMVKGNLLSPPTWPLCGCSTGFLTSLWLVRDTFTTAVTNVSRTSREVITWRWRWPTEKIRLQQSRLCFDVMRRFWLVESRDDVGRRKNYERFVNKPWTCRGQNWSWFFCRERVVNLLGTRWITRIRPHPTWW
jgi:hypothetical protein